MGRVMPEEVNGRLSSGGGLRLLLKRRDAGIFGALGKARRRRLPVGFGLVLVLAACERDAHVAEGLHGTGGRGALEARWLLGWGVRLCEQR